MIWPLAASLYILIGGVGSIGMARVNGSSSSPASSDPGATFALICGCIAIWPVLMALAIDQQLRANRKDDR